MIGTGIAPVRIELVTAPPTFVTSFSVQIAAFTESRKAEDLRALLRDLRKHAKEQLFAWPAKFALLGMSRLNDPILSRLAFFALPRTERRGLAAWLHGRTVRVLAGPVGSVALFAIVVLVTHLPSVYGLALQRVGRQIPAV